MRFIADLHIHSKYSRATSQLLDPEHLEYWAMIKGIDVVATGDCIHPGWLAELEEKLEPCDNGLYRLKPQYRLAETKALRFTKDVYFIFSTEISSIYKQADKTRKVHNLILFSDLDKVKSFQNKIDAIGNIRSDGRPILGLNSKLILEYALACDPQTLFIPAHIWTPWFSVLGSKSGFDSIQECYEDLTQHIYAVETGLSSDPPMNRVCSFLDNFKLISNSDAHSPDKLGREANIFNTELSYNGIYQALRGDEGLEGTLEFFPQEGKYHHDGHRNCEISWNPLETAQHQGICPVCGKEVTKGVLYRVAELADRNDPSEFFKKQTFQSITPLPELWAELLSKKSTSCKAVQTEYFKSIKTLGSEFDILTSINIQEIAKKISPILAEGIRRLREKEVFISEGYDGEFGKVKVFSPSELKRLHSNVLFTFNSNKINQTKYSTKVDFNIQEFQSFIHAQSPSIPLIKEDIEISNYSQTQAISSNFTDPVVILAGPGSGKTKVLTERIAFLLESKQLTEKQILALTFSNQSAEELKARLAKRNIKSVNAGTFHWFGYKLLKKYHQKAGLPPDFLIADQEDIKEIIALLTDKKQNIKTLSKKIEAYKQKRIQTPPFQVTETINKYQTLLRSKNLIDLNDLILLPIEIIKTNPNIQNNIQKEFTSIFVDEMQDLNPIQFQLLLLLLSPNNPQLFCIGDPNQSIYGFRGASPNLFNQLKKIYPSTIYLSLNTCYRCTESIIQAASNLLSKPALQTQKKGSKVLLEECSTDKSEAEWIASKIEFLMGGLSNFSFNSNKSDGNQKKELSFKDFAIICRTKLLFPALKKALEDHQIPYQAIGTKPFYLSEPYLESIKTFKDLYSQKNTNLNKTQNFELSTMFAKKFDISTIIRRILIERNIPYSFHFKLEEFCKPYKNNYTTFLKELALRKGNDDYQSKIEAVSLITIHASKGLEFDTVFIPACQTKIIPFELFLKNNGFDNEEEKRLLYVAMTRAKESLYLSWAKQRIIKGQKIKGKLSPFLDTNEKNYLFSKVRTHRSEKESGLQLDLF